MDCECLYHDSAVSLSATHVTSCWRPEDTAVRQRWPITYGGITTGRECSLTASKCANTVRYVATETRLPDSYPFGYVQIRLSGYS
eukprot:5032772-Pleurochrysis_carterae.AAC.1